MNEMCKVPTTIGLESVKARSAEEALEQIEGHLNPELKKCGELPVCRKCALLAEFVELPAMTKRVVAKLERERFE